ncbi:hypothetical protein [Nocardia altamirensis]|uniref:hypothetical protein n=1 Tax=Nocardia altamirensis TaxID=472158 RepID=UPI000AC9DFA6|nr:hypothetical protein [Nocardia altamirensis]
MNVDNVSADRGPALRIPRSRGALGGLAVLLLGIWGALIPFLGPYFDFAFTPDDSWAWTSARGWLEVLPGATAVIGGLLMLTSRNRLIAGFGGWLAAAAGLWFIIGPFLTDLLNIGTLGDPVATSDLKRAALHLTFFYGLGALILFFAATSLGRLSVRTARDIAFARREVDAKAAARTDTQTAVVPEPVSTTARPATGTKPQLHKPRLGGA